MSDLDVVWNRMTSKYVQIEWYICFYSRAEEPPLVSNTTMNQPVLFPWLHGMDAPCGLSLNQCQTPSVTSCFQPPEVSISSRQFVISNIPIVACGKHPKSSVHSFSHGLENQNVLLPPSSFMTMKSQTKVCKMSCVNWYKRYVHSLVFIKKNTIIYIYLY